MNRLFRYRYLVYAVALFVPLVAIWYVNSQNINLIFQIIVSVVMGIGSMTVATYLLLLALYSRFTQRANKRNAIAKTTDTPQKIAASSVEIISNAEPRTQIATKQYMEPPMETIANPPRINRITPKAFVKNQSSFSSIYLHSLNLFVRVYHRLGKESTSMLEKLTSLFIMKGNQSREAPVIEDYVTVSQAAEILKLKSTGRVRQLLLASVLKGKKFGNYWMVERKSIEEYAKGWRKPGPKPIDR